MPITEPLYNPEEAAERAGVTAETVRRWARTRRVPHVRTPGGRILFRQSDLDALQPQPVEPDPERVA